MIKLLLSISLLVSTIFASEMSMQNRELSSQQMKSQNKTIVQMASIEISKSLPHKIDKYTQLLVVKGVGTTLEYIYEINIAPKSDESVKKEDHSRMKRAVTKGICKSSKRFLDADISISYIYKSKTTKAELFRFNVNQKTCFKL